jgi:hypothetical protein
MQTIDTEYLEGLQSMGNKDSMIFNDNSGKVKDGGLVRHAPVY